MQNIDPNLHEDASMSESPFFQPETSPKTSLFRDMSSHPVPPYGTEAEVGEELPDQAESSEANYANQKSFFDPVEPGKVPASPDPFQGKKAFASGNFQSATKSENEAFQHLSQRNSFFGNDQNPAPIEGLDEEGELPDIATADLPMTELSNSLTGHPGSTNGIFQEATFADSQQAFFDDNQASDASTLPALDNKVVHRAREYQKELASTSAIDQKLTSAFPSSPEAEAEADHERANSLSSVWTVQSSLSPITAKPKTTSSLDHPKAIHNDLAGIQEAALQSKASLEAAADRVASNPELEDRSRKLLEEKRKADQALMRKIQEREETIEAEEIARRQELKRKQRERQQAIYREEELDRINRERFFNNNLEVPSQQTEESFTKNRQGLAFESLPTLPSEKADRAAANALEQLERQTSPSLTDPDLAPSPFSSTPRTVSSNPASLDLSSIVAPGSVPAPSRVPGPGPAPAAIRQPMSPAVPESLVETELMAGPEIPAVGKTPAFAKTPAMDELSSVADIPTVTKAPEPPELPESPVAAVAPGAESSLTPGKKVGPSTEPHLPLEDVKREEASANKEAALTPHQQVSQSEEKPVRKHMDPLDIVDQINEATTTSEGGKRDPFEALDKLEAMGVSLESSAFSLRKHTDYYNAQQDIDISGDEVANKNTQDWVAPWVQAARDQGRTVRQAPVARETSPEQVKVESDAATETPSAEVINPEVEDRPKSKSKLSLPHFGLRNQENQKPLASKPDSLAEPSKNMALKTERVTPRFDGDADKTLDNTLDNTLASQEGSQEKQDKLESSAPSHESKSLASFFGFGKKERSKEAVSQRPDAAVSTASEKSEPKSFSVGRSQESSSVEVQNKEEKDRLSEERQEEDKGFFGLKGKFSLGKAKHEEEVPTPTVNAAAEEEVPKHSYWTQSAPTLDNSTERPFVPGPVDETDQLIPAKKALEVGRELQEESSGQKVDDLREERSNVVRGKEPSEEKGAEPEADIQKFPGAPWLQNVALTKPVVPQVPPVPQEHPVPQPSPVPQEHPVPQPPQRPRKHAPLTASQDSLAESIAPDPENPTPENPAHENPAHDNPAHELPAPEPLAKEEAQTDPTTMSAPTAAPPQASMVADDNISLNFMEQLKAQKTPVSYQFVDCLINILPNMGAFSPVDTRGSAAMLDLLNLQGCHALWICPTFDPLTMNLGQFLERRQEAFEQVMPLLEERGMDYLLGAEVVLREGLTELPNLQVLAMGNKHYMAVTLGKEGHLEDYHIQLLAALRTKCQVIPVLMHMQDTELLKRKETRTVLRSLGCRFAMDISAFNESGFGRRRSLTALVNDGEVDFMGTGACDMLRFQPIIRPIMDKAIKSIHPDAYQRILDGSSESFR